MREVGLDVFSLLCWNYIWTFLYFFIAMDLPIISSCFIVCTESQDIEMIQAQGRVSVIASTTQFWKQHRRDNVSIGNTDPEVSILSVWLLRCRQRWIAQLAEEFGRNSACVRSSLSWIRAIPLTLTKKKESTDGDRVLNRLCAHNGTHKHTHTHGESVSERWQDRWPITSQSQSLWQWYNHWSCCRCGCAFDKQGSCVHWNWQGCFQILGWIWRPKQNSSWAFRPTNHLQVQQEVQRFLSNISW